MICCTNLYRIPSAANVSAVWVYPNPSDASDARDAVKRDDPRARVRVVRRSLSAAGASFFVWCVVIAHPGA